MQRLGRALPAVACLLILASVPALADVLYENGPINGETDAWTINFGFALANTFTISTGDSTVNGVSFGAWLFPGDVLESAEVTLSTESLGGGTIFFDGVVNFTASGCFLNNYSFEVCTETGNFTPTVIGNGTYWLTLQNAIVNNGDPIYWDENSGVGCHSPGCPSEADNGGITRPDTLPSEAFSVLGTSGGTGTVPEPGSLLLFGGAFTALVGTLRRKLR
jgi:PEP-CTERM motif-containing protein